MNDLTLVMPTSNMIREDVAKKIRATLIETTEGKYPIISVSQKPIDFGTNICVGEIGASKYNAYKQILIGAKEVRTEYVAVVDDDTLYSSDHFLFRPPKGAFSYNTNYWFSELGKTFYWRHENPKVRGGMWGFISDTKSLVDNLSRRYELYPSDPYKPDPRRGPPFWSEPGLNDKYFGIESSVVKRRSVNPCVVFVHSFAMGYKNLNRHIFWNRKSGIHPLEDMVESLEQFGPNKELYNKYWAEGVA